MNDNVPTPGRIESVAEINRKLRSIVDRAHTQIPALKHHVADQETYNICARDYRTAQQMIGHIENLLMSPPAMLKDKILLSRLAGYVKYAEYVIEKDS